MKTFGDLKEGDDLYLLVSNVYYKLKVQYTTNDDDAIIVVTDNGNLYRAEKQDTIRFNNCQNNYVTPNKELIIKKLEQELKYIKNQISELKQ